MQGRSRIKPHDDRFTVGREGQIDRLNGDHSQARGINTHFPAIGFVGLSNNMRHSGQRNRHLCGRGADVIVDKPPVVWIIVRRNAR